MCCPNHFSNIPSSSIAAPLHLPPFSLTLHPLTLPSFSTSSPLFLILSCNQPFPLSLLPLSLLLPLPPPPSPSTLLFSCHLLFCMSLPPALLTATIEHRMDVPPHTVHIN